MLAAKLSVSVPDPRDPGSGSVMRNLILAGPRGRSLGSMAVARVLPGDDALVLQPELGRSSSFPLALAGPLLMPAAPARPEAGGLAVRRRGPGPVPGRAARGRRGERRRSGVE